MNFYLIQFILAGRNRNSEGLVDVLIIVFFVIIWVIRSLFMAQKEQTQQKKKTLTRKPIIKSPLNKDRFEKFLENILQPKGPSPIQKKRQSVQKPYMKDSSSIPVASRKPIDKKQIRHPQYKFKKPSIFGAQRLKSPQIQDLPSIDPNLQELPEFTDKTINNLEKIHLTKQKNSTSLNYLSEKLFDKADPDELKKAILYSEILGKPLSIRDFSN